MTSLFGATTTASMPFATAAAQTVPSPPDLTQEVFLKLVTAVYRYSVTGKFTNYLFTIAVNVCNDYYRRKKPDSAELSEDCAALGGAEEQMLRRDSGSVIRRALDELRTSSATPLSCVIGTT